MDRFDVGDGMRRLACIGLVMGQCASSAVAQSTTSAALTPPGMALTAVPTTKAQLPVQPLTSGGRSESTARLTAKVRLRVGVAADPGPRDRMHQRVASSMVEFYPVGGSGFHLSAGTRMYDTRAGDKATGRGLIATPRPGNVPGNRLGLRRTPALTMGYSGEVANGTRVGVELGAMKGRVYNSTRDIVRQTRAERSGNPVNPMVNLVIGRRF